MKTSAPPPNKASSKQKALGSRECSVRIVIYGLEKEKLNVGRLLSEANIFLQHPSAAECRNGIKYCNPHYLLRPGSTMPQLGNLSLSDDPESSLKHDELDEVDMARLLRIFDCADIDGSRVSTAAKPSPRLRSTLMRSVTDLLFRKS